MSVKIKKILILSHENLSQHFSDNSYLINYVDDISNITALMHLDGIDYFIIDANYLIEQKALYKLIKQIAFIHNESKVYFLDRGNAYRPLTNELVKMGFVNFIDYDADDYLKFLNCEITEDEYKLKFYSLTRNPLRNIFIKHYNQKILQSAAKQFHKQRKYPVYIISAILMIILALTFMYIVKGGS